MTYLVNPGFLPNDFSIALVFSPNNFALFVESFYIDPNLLWMLSQHGFYFQFSVMLSLDRYRTVSLASIVVSVCLKTLTANLSPLDLQHGSQSRPIALWV